MTDNDEDLMLVREVLAREAETINLYQKMSAQARTAEVKAFLSHITEEEKEHVAEAFELMKRMDAAQAALFGAGNHWAEPAAPRPAASSMSEEGAQSGLPLASNSLTVGSLRRKG
jgi:hypothetical protein